MGSGFGGQQVESKGFGLGMWGMWGSGWAVNCLFTIAREYHPRGCILHPKQSLKIRGLFTLDPKP